MICGWAPSRRRGREHEVLRQLLTTGMTRFIDEETNARVEADARAVGEDEFGLALRIAWRAVHLLRAHGEHVEVDAVEFITSPQTARDLR